MASKQFDQNGVTLFESIPNEIFIEILSYITSINAVVAFSNLNWHLQRLLTELCHTFDFTSISKKNFDTIFQYQNTNRWHSLKLSDAEHTPGQVSYFFENHALANKFSQLQSLSIVNIIPNHSYPLFAQLSSLSNLVSLEIESLCRENIPEFKLPNLKKLTFSSCPNTSWLKNLTGLEMIEYTITCRCIKAKLLVWPRTLKYLKIVFEDYQDLYQKQPGGFFPRGETWAQIISASIPSLENFKFYFQCICHDHHLNHLKEVVASFSTPFYTLEENRIVRCDVSGRFETPIHDVEYGTYNANMRHVILYTIPFAWTHNLTKLRHITIGDGAAIYLEDFNILLDNASNLCSLTAKKSMLKFLTDNWTDMCICNRLTRRIRSLTFSSDRNPSQCFDINELEKILPIFSSQCQHLSLGIHSHNKTIDFILRKMCHLISLHVYIQRKNSPPITVEWLEQQNMRFNGTNCIITNVRHDHYFWLG
ncbi:unnamed protein product [Rotaria socialis]|uniref:F-box domain-containing protein n=1 Tax=Rotaria socialis TaxID=392032 RepID=A0A818HR00_9BILA|nr:unnamed protein product [Rotaria socialis]CAF3511941.1 unnamed protein product [Rotaria socialis]